MSGEERFRCSLGDTVRERELELRSEELLDVWALDVVGFGEFDNFKDLADAISNIRSSIESVTYVNRPEPRAMSRCHVLVECIHGIRPRHLPILLVHVVRS